MHKTTRNSHTSDYDLHDDLTKIKAALAAATFDAKGKARELLVQSLDDMKDKSAEVQYTVTKYVMKKPLKSLGIAALVGAIFGYLMHK